jgi:hypothetical protein
MRKRSFVKDSKSPSGGVLLGYARVSKGDEQSNAVQAKAIRAAGCRRIFEEAASGARWDRPELHRMLDHLREGDTVVVWKLDRLSRSLKDVLEAGELALGLQGFKEYAGHFGLAGRPDSPEARSGYSDDRQLNQDVLELKERVDAMFANSKILSP